MENMENMESFESMLEQSWEKQRYLSRQNREGYCYSKR